MMEAASKKQRGMAVQILSKLGVDQSMRRGDERYTQRLIKYELIILFMKRKIRILELASIYVPTQGAGSLPSFI